MSKYTRWDILGRKENETFVQEVKNRSFPASLSTAIRFSMDEVQRIREIQILKQLNGHPNIIFLREIIL